MNLRRTAMILAVATSVSVGYAQSNTGYQGQPTPQGSAASNDKSQNTPKHHKAKKQKSQQGSATDNGSSQGSGTGANGSTSKGSPTNGSTSPR